MPKIALSCLLVLTLEVQARVVDININNSSVEGQYISTAQFATALNSGFTAYFNEDGVNYFSIDFQSQLEAAQNSGVIFGLGVNSFLLVQPLETGEAADDVNLGLAILLQSGYRFAVNAIPTQVVLNLGHSPNIINSGGMNTLTRINLRSEFHITPSVITYLGYRNDSATYNHENVQADETYDSSLALGFRFRF